ncbi:helix-turn-helix domain-containing protein [Paraburkholderia humisilvae]|uniref:helix-turn-helix domain-containing protein n=1 Tax=Paraburkholderia humisilvae TaxID=627669 RepID=UPI001C2E1BD6
MKGTAPETRKPATHTLRRAREMLAHELSSIAEVAYAVGFSSQAHMTSIFTRRLGVTPAQIRKSAARLSV